MVVFLCKEGLLTFGSKNAAWVFQILICYSRLRADVSSRTQLLPENFYLVVGLLNPFQLLTIPKVIFQVLDPAIKPCLYNFTPLCEQPIFYCI